MAFRTASRVTLGQKRQNLEQATRLLSAGISACTLQFIRGFLSVGQRSLTSSMAIFIWMCGFIFAGSMAFAADINTAYVGIELRLNGTEIYANLLRTWPNQKFNSSDSVATDAGVSLSNDLHQRVQSGQLSASDALQIESELMMRHGSVYYLPANQDELKEVVGFPHEKTLTAVELRDLIPVHTQMSLGIGVMASAYLVDKLKVKITVTEAEAAAVGITPTIMPTVLPTAAPPLAPAQEPTQVRITHPAETPPAPVPSADLAPAAPPTSIEPAQVEPTLKTPIHSDAPSIPAPPSGDSVGPVLTFDANPNDPSATSPGVQAESGAIETTHF